MVEVVNDTLKERGSRYGDFTDHARIAQALQDTMRAEAGWQRLSAVQRQALSVIADKLARIINGDANYIDSFRDIAGYSTLVVRDLDKHIGATDTKSVLMVRTEAGWVEAGLGGKDE